MDTVLRYRQYGCDELYRFFGNAVFYSRSSHFRANCPDRPDVLKTAYETESGIVAKGGRIRVILEIHKYGDLSAASRNQGLRMQRRNPHPIGYQFHIKEGQRTIDVVTKVQTIMDNIMAELPIIMYSTAQARQVRNYMEFMSSTAVKKRYSDIVKIIKSCRTETVSTVPITNYGLIEKNGLDSFHVMRLPDGGWAAWIEGDDLIPIFPNELQTYRFMKDRFNLYEGFNRTAYDELFSGKNAVN